MDASIWIAGMGFVATLLSAWLGSRWTRGADLEARLLEARLRVYGECVTALAEYRRATHHRVKTRIDAWPEEKREPLRQEAYRANAKARAATGEAVIVSGKPDIADDLERIRVRIGQLNAVNDKAMLDAQVVALDKDLGTALDRARDGLTTRRSLR